VHQRLHTLGGDVDAAAQALQVFLTAFVSSMPTGHENAFAHRTTPSLVAVVVRDDQPVNLVSAFEDPVHATGHGIARASALRLAEELRQASDLWGLSPVHVASTYAATTGDAAAMAAALGESLPFPQTVAATVQAVRDQLAGGNA
jgi:CRISPR system Cascade subunit CasC